MALKKATKEQAKLRLAIFGLSGSGKTYTALATAEGLVKVFGGKVAVLDTEFRSASKYANIFDFVTDDFGEPSIENYIKFIDMCKEDPDVTVLIIDSLTHGWQYILEQVSKIELTCGQRNATEYAWSQMTPVYKKLVNAILMAPFHVIVTMRAKKEGSSYRKGSDKTDNQNTLAAEQRKGFEYEVDMVMAISAEHYGNVIKDRTGKFQDEIIQKPGVEFGRKLAEWLKDGAVPMDKQIQAVLNEIGNIVKSKSEKEEPYFTEKEYESIKAMCKDSISKSQDERLEFLQEVLAEQKKILQDRVSQLPPQPLAKPAETKPPITGKEAETVAKDSKPKEESLTEGFQKHLAEKQAAQARSDTPPNDVPVMYSEPERDDHFEDDIPGQETETVMAEAELDIF